MIIKNTLIFFCFIIFFFGYSLVPDDAVVSQEKHVLKTYPYYDPDPIPKPGPIYPYFKFDGYSKMGKNQEWQVIRLENPYIKVYITPEIGGKIWGAIEKSTGMSFIYFNKVVKFRNIAMRGPWTSGGIEFNFGAIGHAPTCSTPVDYYLKKNADGSVSCIVGAMDLPSRTQWRVHVRLPKNKAFFETESLWYNPNPLHQSYYHWLNAAARSSDDLKFYYPGTHFIDHGGKAHPWPKDDLGRNISVYKNNNFGSHKSYHVLGQYTEHFGGYWENAKFGFGNWSKYDDKPGKKLWLWALSRQGEIWRDLLTDEDNHQYIEFQSGRLFNQANRGSSMTPFKHAYFDPLVLDKWREIWFPIKDIGGMVEANPYCVLNVETQNNMLYLGICALQSINDKLTVLASGETMFSQPLLLQPMDTFKKRLLLPVNRKEILIKINNKMVYLHENNVEKILRRPLIQNNQLDFNSAEGLYAKGEELAKQRDYNMALASFSQCLKSQPAHINALTRLAELYFRRGEPQKALEYAQRALSYDTYHAGANFIYGVINRKLGFFTDAKDGFGWASRSLEYRSAAYAQIAGLYLREKNTEGAKEYAQRALDFNKYNLNAYQLLVISCRLDNHNSESRQYLNKILLIDPINHFSRFEKYLLQPGQENLSSFTSLIKNELPHETFLELALFYVNLGLNTEAIRVLEIAPASPIIDLWLSYLKKEKPIESGIHLDRALKSSPNLVFPFRMETIQILQWAIREKSHWKTNYYLALILWNKGRTEEAFNLLEKCGDDPDFFPFYIARGNLRIEVSEQNTLNQADHKKSYFDYRKAWDIGKKDWRTWDTLYAYYRHHRMNSDTLRISKNACQQFPHNYILAMNLARAMLENEMYRECLLILKRTTILPYEGAREARDIYRQACCLLAAESFQKNKYSLALNYVEKARLWPENLGVGKPYSPDERLENYLAALCYEKIGDVNKMNQLHNSIYLYTKKNWTNWGAFFQISVLTMRRMGKNDEAQNLISQWKGNENVEDRESIFLRKVLTTLDKK